MQTIRGFVYNILINISASAYAFALIVRYGLEEAEEMARLEQKISEIVQDVIHKKQ